MDRPVVRVTAAEALLADVVATALARLTGQPVQPRASSAATGAGVEVVLEDLSVRVHRQGVSQQVTGLHQLARAVADATSAPAPPGPGVHRSAGWTAAPVHAHLTARELQVLRAIRCGDDNAAIAVSLGISVHTARTHVSSVLRKTGSASRVDAIARAH